jgi:hypothetical protein
VKTPPATGVLIGISTHEHPGRRNPDKGREETARLALGSDPAGLAIVELVSELDHLQA